MIKRFSVLRMTFRKNKDVHEQARSRIAHDIVIETDGIAAAATLEWEFAAIIIEREQCYKEKV